MGQMDHSTTDQRGRSVQRVLMDQRAHCSLYLPVRMGLMVHYCQYQLDPKGHKVRRVHLLKAPKDPKALKDHSDRWGQMYHLLRQVR